MEAHLDIKNILVRILLFFKVFFKYEIQSYDNLKDLTNLRSSAYLCIGIFKRIFK